MGAGVKRSPECLSEIRALLQLKTLPRLGDRGIKKLVDRWGSGARALRAAGLQTRLPLSREEPEEGDPLASWLEGEYEVLPMTSPLYPAALLQLSDPPPILFLKGRRESLSAPAVAVVGSRRATSVGRRTAEALGFALAHAGVTVVSGMALGIDGEAHRGALRAGGRTLAVLGSGFDVVYPASHRSLFHQIGREGLLISEFLPHEEAMRHHFPKRNRIIAALVCGVVVVEAGRKSGALITVDHALDLGREIFVTPGSMENAQAVGSNALLKEGARVLLDPDDLLQELQDLGISLEAPGEEDVWGRGRDPDLPPRLRALWSALSTDPVGVDEVAIRAAVSAAEALQGLSALELGGWARQCPGMRYRRR